MAITWKALKDAIRLLGILDDDKIAHIVLDFRNNALPGIVLEITSQGISIVKKDMGEKNGRGE